MSSFEVVEFVNDNQPKSLLELFKRIQERTLHPREDFIWAANQLPEQKDTNTEMIEWRRKYDAEIGGKR